MASANPNPKHSQARILRRWDDIAMHQLAAIAAQLHEENIRLREQLHYAEDAAESWRADALRMVQDACADGDNCPGITRDGNLVLLPIAAAQGGSA